MLISSNSDNIAFAHVYMGKSYIVIFKGLGFRVGMKGKAHSITWT